MRCLDAGCGPGEVMRLMGRTVGPEGHVTGLDIDARLGAHMLAELHREEGAQFGFVAADLMRGDPVPGAPFDFVFARHLLIHMTDPVTAVRRLGALVRPGGKLVLMDFDLSRLACRPEHPALRRGFEVVTACFTRSGKDPDCGLQLARYLEAAGLQAPAETIAETSYAPISRRGTDGPLGAGEPRPSRPGARRRRARRDRRLAGTRSPRWRRRTGTSPSAR